MQEILKNKYIRRLFWIITISFLIILFFLRFYVFNDLTENSTEINLFLADLCEDLIASLITTVAIGSFIFYVAPKLDPKDGAEFIHSTDFEKYFTTVLKSKPDTWYFRGGFGRYLRSVVLPNLHEVAKDATRVNITAQILNPKNERLCKLHAALRNTVKNADNKTDWDLDEVKINLYATIVSCAIYESMNSYLNISVYLIDFFSSDRVDISTNSGIITKDDQKAPGLKFNKSSIHYKTYMADLHVTQQQAIDVVNKLSVVRKIGEVSADNAKEVLEELGFNETFNLDQFQKIANLVNEQKNPYA